MKKNRFKKLMINEIEIWKEFELENDNFLECRKKYSKEFLEIYNQGFDFYISGDWEKAKALFEQAQEMLEEIDNPIQKLLDFINENNCVTHLDWIGAKTIHDF